MFSLTKHGLLCLLVLVSTILPRLTWADTLIPRWKQRTSAVGAPSGTRGKNAAQSADGSTTVTYEVDSGRGVETVVCRYNAAGRLLWESRIPDFAHYALNLPLGLVLDSEGNAYALGTNVLAKCAASDGAIVWSMENPDVGPDQFIMSAIAIDTAGDLLAVGHRYVATKGSRDLGSEPLTRKLAGKDGSELWSRPLDGAQRVWIEPMAVAVDNQGDAIVAGASDGQIVAQKYAGTDGAVLWTATGKEESTIVLAVSTTGDVAIGTAPLYHGERAIDTSRVTTLDGRTGVVERYRETRDVLDHLAFDPWDNLIISGNEYDLATRTYLPYVAKLSAVDGQQLWRKARNETIALKGATVVGLAVDGAGNVYTAQAIRPESDSDEYGNEMLTMAYAAADGELQWQTAHVSTDANASDSPEALVVDSAGNVTLVGRSPDATQGDGYVARYAADSGAQMWEQHYLGVGTRGEQAQAHTTDGAGHVISVLQTWKYTSPRHSVNNSETVKHSVVDGTVLWRVEAPESVSLSYIRADAVGDVIVAGWIAGDLSSSYVAKYRGTDGEILWEKRLDTLVRGLLIDSHGRAIIQANGREPESRTETIMQLSGTDGNVLWARAMVIGGMMPLNSLVGVLDSNDNVIVTPGGNRLAKLAAGDGHVQWDSELAAPDRYYPFVKCISIDAAGSTIVSGEDGYLGKFANASGAPIWQVAGQSVPELYSYVVRQVVDATGDVVVLKQVYGGANRITKYSGVDGRRLWLQSAPEFGVKFEMLACTSRGEVVVLGTQAYGDYFSRRRLYLALYAGETGALTGVRREDATEGDFEDYEHPAIYDLTTGPGGVVAVTANLKNWLDTDAMTILYGPVADVPTITLLGTNPVSVDTIAGYYDAGAMAYDSIDGPLLGPSSADFTDVGPFEIPETYPVNYIATNSRGNVAGATRFVQVPRRDGPVITVSKEVYEATGDNGGVIGQYRGVMISNGGAFPEITYDPPEGSQFPLGVSSVHVTVNDRQGHSVTKDFEVTVRDLYSPILSGTFSPLAYTGSWYPDFRNQAHVVDQTTVTLTQAPSPGSPLMPGRNTVVITATDLGGNQASVSFEIEARLDAPAHRKVLGTGANAPGAGDPHGPPAGAKLIALGVPAIDEGGVLAFLARWKQGPRSGTGIFTSDRCVALVREDAPSALGSVFHSLANPLVDDGHVAFLATLAGPAARARVVCSDAPRGSLEIIARSGDQAVGIENARFRSFQSVGVSGSAVAFKARAAANAREVIGVWACDATHPLRALLYEGQTVAGHVITRLFAFQSPIDSPGQGRGWLLATGGVTRVQALASCRDGSQLCLSATFDELPEILAQTATTYGFAFTDAPSRMALKDFSLPAFDPAGEVALQSKVLSADGLLFNARRIVGRLSDPAAGLFASLTFATGPRFDEFLDFSDPVLAGGATGIAFKGAIHRNPRAIWWQRAGYFGTTSVAGIGQRLTGNPAMRWQAFGSLAIIPGRGPLFTAMVSDLGASLWATDLDGHLRSVIRVGQEIDGQIVRQFNLLNALPGCTGSTRSFNASGQIAWRAMLAGGGQALVVTQAP